MTAYAERDRLKLLALFLNRVEPENYMKKENITSYLLATCVILLLFVVFRDDENSEKNPNLDARLNELEVMVNKMATSSDEQASLLHRAIGEVIPITIPSRINEKLNALKEKLIQKDSWPQNMNDMNASDAELLAILAEVSPWMEEELLPELNSIRWFLGAHELRLKEEKLKFDEWLDYIDDLETQISFSPDNASEEVLSQLEKLRRKFSADYESLRRDLAYAKAEKSLKDANATPEILYEILDQLSEWEDFEELTEEITVKAMKMESEGFISSVQERIELMSKESNATFKRINMGNLGEFLGLIVDQRNELLAFGVQRNEPIQKKLKALAAKIEKDIKNFATSEVKENEKKMRSYQKRALEKIIAFNNALPNAKITEVGRIFDTEKQDFEKIKNLMISHLLPIDSRMLEPAVSRIYNKAFKDGWDILEDEKDLQTEVAEREAVVEKMKL